MAEVSLEEFLKVSLLAVCKAGTRVYELYHSSFAVQWKQKNDPLTEADLQANQIIQSELMSYFPDIPIISEENKKNPTHTNSQFFWSLDPIDGTKEFINKNPEFAISLGLCLEGEAILGVVFNPATGEIVLGAKGLGVCTTTLVHPFHIKFDGLNFSRPLSGKNLCPKPITMVSQLEFTRGNYDTDPVWKQALDLRPIGSIAYKLALLSADRSDLVLSTLSKNQWDIAAGIALVQAAGGLVYELTSLSNAKISFNNHIVKGLIATDPVNMDFLVQNYSANLKQAFLPIKYHEL